jgi:GNAT superfamily N-acetyltransferase
MLQPCVTGAKSVPFGEDVVAGAELGARFRARKGDERAWLGPFRAYLPSTLAKIVELRQLVWTREPDVISAQLLDPNATMLQDAYEADGLHWVVTLDDAVVAAARLSLHHDETKLPDWERFQHLAADLPKPVAMLSRLVVHPAQRREGFARALTAVRIDAARSWGARSILSEAAPERAGQLRSLGFRELGQTPPQPWDVAPFTLMALACDPEADRTPGRKVGR